MNDMKDLGDLEDYFKEIDNANIIDMLEDNIGKQNKTLLYCDSPFYKHDAHQVPDGFRNESVFDISMFPDSLEELDKFEIDDEEMQVCDINFLETSSTIKENNNEAYIKSNNENNSMDDSYSDCSWSPASETSFDDTDNVSDTDSNNNNCKSDLDTDDNDDWSPHDDWSPKSKSKAKQKRLKIKKTTERVKSSLKKPSISHKRRPVPQRRSEGTSLTIPQWLLSLLRNPEYNPSVITWVDEPSGLFEIRDTDRIGELWGVHKNNNSMNYEKLSRALRYHYSNQMMVAVPEKRLTYKFGPMMFNRRAANVKDPNFEKSH